MATIITSECINCGACEPECPNTAIYQGGVEWEAPAGGLIAALSDEIFYIVPEKCTECVGFHDEEACAAVCPVDCCVPDPDIPETHEVLLARARELHPDESIPDDAPSRFKAGATEPTSAGGAVAPATAAPAAPVAAPKTARGKVEKAGAAPRTKRPEKAFAGELPDDFELVLASLGAPRRRLASALLAIPLGFLAVFQGILGALPGTRLRQLEELVSDTRFFKAELAMAGNVSLNLLLYPLLCVSFAVVVRGLEVFTQDLRWWTFLGFSIGLVEAAWRLGDNFFRGVPLAEVKPRGALYGLAVVPLAWLVTALLGRRGVSQGIGFDGFYGSDQPFDDKLERARRYGDVFKVQERDDAYLLRVEFPRHVPPTSLGEELGLPDEMPDYDFDLAVRGRSFEVHGWVIDPRVRKLTGAAPAFPSDFTTRIALDCPVSGFRHRYRDKTLEVILPKATE